MANINLSTLINGSESLGFTGSRGFTGSAGTNGILGANGFTGSKGDTGIGFTIAKTYASVAALTADTAPTGIPAGQFAIIETGSAENTENSRLYLWNGTTYTYVTDLSGAQGITGAKGDTGFTGSTGSIGYTGSASTVIGFTGSAGEFGYTGSASTVIGFTGSAGEIITSTSSFTTFTNVPYDIGSSVLGKPTASVVVLRFRAARPFTVVTTGHQAIADIAATSSTVFTIAKNNTTIGNASFASGATTATVTVASTSFAAGDKLIITAPAGVDATLADIDFTLVAKLD